jgi:hypothetical protein
LSLQLYNPRQGGYIITTFIFDLSFGNLTVSSRDTTPESFTQRPTMAPFTLLGQNMTSPITMRSISDTPLPSWLSQSPGSTIVFGCFFTIVSTLIIRFVCWVADVAITDIWSWFRRVLHCLITRTRTYHPSQNTYLSEAHFLSTKHSIMASDRLSSSQSRHLYVLTLSKTPAVLELTFCSGRWHFIRSDTTNGRRESHG